jgi:hypothetical protein
MVGPETPQERKMFQRCWSAILPGCMRARATPNVIE